MPSNSALRPLSLSFQDMMCAVVREAEQCIEIDPGGVVFKMKLLGC